eukprot:TRINITY_DN2905_c0_g2_i1.p3 TRINITY_DN2905_c0_g2~~TRINITY_DN2905_c0_g2_i1.p3  ORF type:complete len:144 (-),score=33.97 TRINITY_DN2905_c0_g2_i1:19-450(-)
MRLERQFRLEDAPKAVTISSGQHQLPTTLGIASSSVARRLALEAPTLEAEEAVEAQLEALELVLPTSGALSSGRRSPSASLAAALPRAGAKSQRTRTPAEAAPTVVHATEAKVLNSCSSAIGFPNLRHNQEIQGRPGFKTMNA